MPENENRPDDRNRNDDSWENYQRWNAEYRAEHVALGKGGFGRVLLGLFWIILAGAVYAGIATLLGKDFGEAVLEAMVGVAGAVMAIGIGYAIYAAIISN